MSGVVLALGLGFGLRLGLGFGLWFGLGTGKGQFKVKLGRCAQDSA
jgi:hypothetical protein